MAFTRCASCGAEVASEGRFCAHCGASLAASAVVTAAPEGDRSVRPQADGDRSVRLQADPPASDGRFPVGIILGERYRILGLLGRGGMGEVYRAHDLKLEQQVALKFLPESAAFNPSLMERFRSEVRIARQISHRNVCRVYDLGEVNGAAFISMEYVDGEDLASLLRRIGRLPGDKALEFARRLCAGLAAAHEKGVLHRDLKPANIMIDGRGQLLIMDFGLAAVADAITGHDIRSGTPAYMSPEQKEGRDVTVRSDIYALGMVLAEMFSGSRPAADGTLSSTTKDVDPAVEKVIRRCVDPNPAQRFASALDVARALPGGDPLAEALAAGETPSPEMVAASDDTGALSVRAAVVCFAFVLVALIAAVLQRDQVSVLRVIPTPHSPEVLEQKARELAVRFGYGDAPQDEAIGFTTDGGYGDYAEANWTPQEYRARLATGWPPLIGFWYRRSPTVLTPGNGPAVTREDPPLTVSDMVRVELDLQGRLYHFSAVPPQAETPDAGPVDWKELFSAAGLEQSRFQPSQPDWVPPVSFDSRAAWTGMLERLPEVSISIEAASWKGRLVYFRMVQPWTRPVREQFVVTPVLRVRAWLSVGVTLAVFLIAGLLAWRHYRSTRGDLRGSARLAGFAAVCSLLAWFFTAHHIPTLGEIFLLPDAISSAAFWALILGGFYMALEPYVRRRWPQSLIGWTRLLAGGIRDPLVTGQALVGIACGLVSFLVIGTLVLLDRARVELPSLLTLLGPGPAVGSAFQSLTRTILITLFVFFSVFLVRTALRRDWVAALVVTAFPVVLLPGPDPLSRIALGSLVALGILVLLRFGLLPLVAATFVHWVLLYFPITSDFSAWYSGASLIALGTILALAVWSFRAALGGRKLLEAVLLDA